MKTLLIGVAAAGLLTATGAIAKDQSTSGSASSQTSSGQSSMGQSPSSQSSQSSTSAGTTDKSSSATQSPSSQSTSSQVSTSPSGSATASSTSEISGVVKKVDKDKRKVKISSPSGGEQELKLADTATITKDDGSSASLDQLKEGTNVRASFDPSSNQATRLEIQSSAAGSKSDTSSDTKSKTDTSKSDTSKSDSKKY